MPLYAKGLAHEYKKLDDAGQTITIRVFVQLAAPVRRIRIEKWELLPGYYALLEQRPPLDAVTRRQVLIDLRTKFGRSTADILTLSN